MMQEKKCKFFNIKDAFHFKNWYWSLDASNKLCMFEGLSSSLDSSTIEYNGISNDSFWTMAGRNK